MTMYGEEFDQIQAIIEHLVEEVGVKAAFLVTRGGHLAAQSGHVDNLDITSFASLIAGDIAAKKDGTPELRGENDIPARLRDQEKVDVHLTLVGTDFILATLFDPEVNRGIAPRAQEASDAIDNIVAIILDKIYSRDENALVGEIAFDEDLDSLFDD